jgi:hypothetical protein
MLVQEGLAARFAGHGDVLSPTQLEGAGGIIDALDPAHASYPESFAVLYGDAAARELGYPPLGLPARAGFAVAMARERRDPVEVLASAQGRER